MRVLFISPYPTEGPSFRYRVEQYFEYISKSGVDYTARPFMSSNFFKIVYKPRKRIKKCAYFLLSSILRCRDFIASFKYDVIFIHLEAYPIGPPIFEFLWSKLGRPIIYDLDDAIYLVDKKSAFRLVKFLKCSKKVETIIRLSREIIVCNQHLKCFAANFKNNNNVHIIPTSLNTDKFVPNPCVDMSKGLVIGWIGSYSTAPYLNELRKVFESLSDKYDLTLKVVGSNMVFQIDGVRIINKEWSLLSDLEDFQSLDIGVYPLPDNEWVKGKTGFKTIQYMSVGIPCVVSNVGRNKEIIVDGINGFLADTDAEWIRKLSLLIENTQLRKKMGLAGRKTVEEKYSINVNAPLFLNIIKKVHNNG